MNKKWINIDQKELNKPSNKKENGVILRMFLSPYDIPEAVAGHQEDGKIYVEFRYVAGSEPLKKERVTKNLWFHVGKNSGRVYKIEMNDKLLLEEDAIHLEFFADKVSENIDSFKDKHVKFASKSLDAIRSWLRKQPEELLQAVNA